MSNPPASPGSSTFPTYARLIHLFFNWRTFGRVLVGLGGLVTLTALFYGEENWRGRHAWNQYRHELEARGVPLDFQALRPKPVPDDQNFAATPSVRAWFEKPYGTDFDARWEDNFSLASKRVLSSRERSYDSGTRRFMDLVAWETAFAAIRAGGPVPRNPPGSKSLQPRLGMRRDSGNQEEDFASNQLDLESRAKAAPGVLEGLKTNEAIFAELRAASRRPFARYPINYDAEFQYAILTPHQGNLRAVLERLELRACAELAASRREMALEDVKLMLCLVDSQKAEPLFFSQWARVFLLQIAVQPIWEGLAERAWSQPQLQELTTRLQRYDFLADCNLGLDAQRAGVLWSIDRLQKSDQLSYLVGSFGDNAYNGTLAQLTAWPRLMGRITPSGWFAREKLGYCQLFQTCLRSGFEPSRKRVSPVEIEVNATEARELYHQKYQPPGLRALLVLRYLVGGLIDPNFDGIVRRFCFAQTTADQAALACALEQYRLAHGQFPETLEALTPRLISQLPKDVLTGEPCKYRRTDDGQFVLYSVGWNEKDDGGTVVLQHNGSVDLQNGDWVWEYPTR